jgi:hypothetical protein
LMPVCCAFAAMTAMNRIIIKVSFVFIGLIDVLVFS